MNRTSAKSPAINQQKLDLINESRRINLNYLPGPSLPRQLAAGCAAHSIFLSISRQTRLASSRHSPQEIILASGSGPGPRLGVLGVNAAKLLPNDHFLHLRQGNVTPACCWKRETGIELRFKHYLNTVTISRCLLRGVTKPQQSGQERGSVIVCRQSRLGGGGG